MKLKYIFSVMLLAIATTSVAQKLEIFHNSNGKYGFKDSSDNIVIPPKFDKALDFLEGLAPVKLNGKWGYIDQQGNFVIQPRFEYADYFQDGLARVQLNGKEGYIDKIGDFVIQPQFDDLGDFTEGLAWAKLNGKGGYIDQKGNFVIQPQFELWRDFHDGLAIVQLNGKWGCIDQKGNFVIQPQFDDIAWFNEGLAWAELNGKRGYLDKKGNFVIQPRFERASYFQDGLAIVQLNGKFGFIDQKGNFVIQPQFDDLSDFTEGLAWAKLNGKCGYIDKNGNYYDDKKTAELAIKRLQPGESYAAYVNRIVGCLEDYVVIYGLQKPTLADIEEIKLQVEREINVWQKKGEFETTAQWQQRVNEITRNAKIKEITSRIQSENKRMVDSYNSELADCKKSYEMAVRTSSDRYCAEKAKQFASQQFELKPYDADNETFLISSQTAGDILLPVPIANARAFKDSWASIKGSAKAVYVPVGDDVALKSVTFGDYTYDSNTKADYAVTTVDYNFKPIEISDVELASVDYKFDNIGAAPAVTVSNPDAKTVTTTKVTPQQNKVTVGTASDVDLNIPTGSASAKNTFAIVIANENYQNVENVDNAANDGKVVTKYLTSTLGIPQNQVFAYTDASFGNMLDAFDRIKNIAKAWTDFNVIFYYAGHGVPDEQSKEAYLLPIDGKPGSSAVNIALSKVYDTLGNLGASSVLVMLDACFSGSQRGDGMLAQARGVAIKAKAAVPKGNMIVLSAAQGDETAYPYKAKSHGLFTYFLLKKLQDTKGNVTIGELSDYIIDNVKKTSVIENNGKIQTPTVSASQSATNFWRNQKLTK